MLIHHFASRALLLVGPLLLLSSVASAQLVPGTGSLVNKDDFEDASFTYTHNWPKSSKEEDEQVRYPLGAASNGMWNESPKRGSPDVVKRVETPAGGLSGSTGALYLRTRDSGIPGQPDFNFRKEGYHQAQDDFIMKARPMSLSYSPSTVIRVYLPEWENWEQRNGVSFGVRLGMQGPQEKEEEVGFGLFGRKRKAKTKVENEPYYPGIFIQFVPGNDPKNKEKQPYAMLLLRADELGHEIQGPVIRQPGWWTLGMSVTPDARVHYYAHAGVHDLTAADHIKSSFPYRIQGTTFNTIFFNVCSADTGNSWSTPWIIDDPQVFTGSGRIQQANIPGTRR